VTTSTAPGQVYEQLMRSVRSPKRTPLAERYFSSPDSTSSSPFSSPLPGAMGGIPLTPGRWQSPVQSVDSVSSTGSSPGLSLSFSDSLSGVPLTPGRKSSASSLSGSESTENRGKGGGGGCDEKEKEKQKKKNRKKKGKQ